MLKLLRSRNLNIWCDWWNCFGTTSEPLSNRSKSHVNIKALKNRQHFYRHNIRVFKILKIEESIRWKKQRNNFNILQFENIVNIFMFLTIIALWNYLKVNTVPFYHQVCFLNFPVHARHVTFSIHWCIFISSFTRQRSFL